MGAVASSGHSLDDVAQGGEHWLIRLQSSHDGLTGSEATARLARHGPNVTNGFHAVEPWRLLVSQLRNPLIGLLIGGSILSALTAQWFEAMLVLAMVFGSTALGFSQEFVAGSAVARLQNRLVTRATVRRAGRDIEVAVRELVPGDLVILRAGSLVPADGVLLEARDLMVNESALTGESFVVEKGVEPAASGVRFAEQTHRVFQGTHVVSGAGLAVLVTTGRTTVMGQLATQLAARAPLSDFERGLRRFGYLLSRLILVMFAVVWVFNLVTGRPAMDSLLFALALAVGLTPELLPAIVSVNLAHGARRMARSGVIVRRLDAIENLGTMDVLCIDKTGTLTTGRVVLTESLDAEGSASRPVLRLAALNATHQSGFRNPLDEAVLEAARRAGLDLAPSRKIDEIPYDFSRRCVSVVVEESAERRLILKGAVAEVLERCDLAPDSPLRRQVDECVEAWSARGCRVLAIADRILSPATGGADRVRYDRDDERQLVLRGLLVFSDPPKPDAAAVVGALREVGVGIRLVTGDNRHAARYAAQQLNERVAAILTGDELATLTDLALRERVLHVDVYAEIDPAGKERIIRALQTAGHVVGFMGDGINDALALRSADVGISVDTAVDVAKESADFVLLSKDLGLIRTGIEQGRRTFANTQKYILTTLSANFGNMTSMAVASVALPFLPLTAAQILFNNLLSDIPAMAIAADRVDPEDVQAPRRWNVQAIRRDMVSFGLISASFDLLTFLILIGVFEAGAEEFRSVWFFESLYTELVVALIVRTRRPFHASRPATGLWVTTLAVALGAAWLPVTVVGEALALQPIPPVLIATIAALVIGYVLTVERYKTYRYARWMDLPPSEAANGTKPEV